MYYIFLFIFQGTVIVISSEIQFKLKTGHFKSLFDKNVSDIFVSDNVFHCFRGINISASQKKSETKILNFLGLKHKYHIESCSDKGTVVNLTSHSINDMY